MGPEARRVVASSIVSEAATTIGQSARALRKLTRHPFRVESTGWTALQRDVQRVRTWRGDPRGRPSLHRVSQRAPRLRLRGDDDSVATAEVLWQGQRIGLGKAGAAQRPVPVEEVRITI